MLQMNFIYLNYLLPKYYFSQAEGKKYSQNNVQMYDHSCTLAKYTKNGLESMKTCTLKIQSTTNMIPI